MKALILVAGYATRLYPLTLNQPKALLPIAKKPILNYIVDEIETIPSVNEIILVSNNKFYKNFIEWKQENSFSVPVTVLNDYTTDETNKLGAIGDIQYVIDKLNINEDLLVMAGDNIFTFSLIDFYNAYVEKNSDTILVKNINSIADLRRMANVEVNEDGFVVGMIEKPQNPKTNLAAFASYIYKKDTLPLIKEFLQSGENPDAPGFFPSWLFNKKSVYAYRFVGECYDIGTPESYEKVNRIFEQRSRD
jgi:glucose-1-phosphate thymidylyltransferase